jgi:hypothetical protein
MKLDVNRWIPAVVLGGVLLSAGCASWDGYAGVDNRWRAEDVPAWEPGKTKAAEVVNFLGPPSQLIPLHDETKNFAYSNEALPYESANDD